ncbi:P-loop containing nucleoside triphosphate hydrolase protein [Jimgerdemannia flammicorona]|uniref:P-loop containing nucleoside triphosphate hydrolase protein n=1 Tax=Jimgerdemannia flammicorona TaxID=994334 RepID=A0A433Q8B1_9FUNG|nr:P-loop containing nucleoside triphosphate hydrolase protein [Jimgerdemannia flammicorona]
MRTNDLPPSLAHSKYGSTDKEVLELLNRLRSFGISSEIDLSTIVFCGNQSAGKSSLLEAISDIQLPKSDGTCTRCPMELRLVKTSAPWSCQVKIRWEYHDTENRKLESIHEVAFGDVIFDIHDVEDRVRRAQRAVLNPSASYSTFLSGDLSKDDANNLKFSKNVVCIDVTGEDCPNLSLMDLPGIIRHTEDGDEKLVNLILESVDYYISKKNAIIIATITCKDDIENQEIVKMARDHDSEGIRTLGVLTKPDTIEQGCFDKYFKIICGHSHPLNLGYYAVRNSTQAELLKGDTDARAVETAFFKTDVWRHLPPERLGVPNLTKQLSSLLIAAIKRQLPGIKSEVIIKLQEVTNRLGDLPQVISGHPRLEASKLVGVFTRHVECEIQANTNTDLWCRIYPHFMEFRKRIRATRLHFKADAQTTPSNSVSFHEYNEPEDAGNPLLPSITHQEIEELIQKYRGRQIEGFTPYQAFRKLVEKSNIHWKDPALACLSSVANEFLQYLEEEIKNVFAAYPLLSREISSIVRRLHHKHQEAAKNLLETVMIPMETKLSPFTWNHDHLIYHRDYFRNPTANQNVDGIRDLTAMVRAYIMVAHKRFTDNVPLSIDLIFLREFTEQLHESLVDQLGIVNPKDEVNVEMLMEEDEGILAERKSLWAKHECFMKAFDELDRIIF